MCPPLKILHSHTCGNCGASWSHRRADIAPGAWEEEHSCHVCGSGPRSGVITGVKTMPWNRGRWYPPNNSYLGCADSTCDPCPVYSDWCCTSSGESTSSGATGMPSLPPAQDANSTAAGGSLPATGAPAAPSPAAPGTTPQWLQNVTNFQTPYPYLAIGGSILLVALLTGGGRSRGGSAPPIIHYG